jgi:hypothetical protein
MTRADNQAEASAARKRRKGSRTSVGQGSIPDSSLATPLSRASIFRRYGFAWITAGFLVITLAGHWVFGWLAYAQEQRAHRQPLSVPDYAIEMARDTFENWQSEFLQLLWQVGGLALLLYVGSPQSAEGDARQEEKLDAILRAVAPKDADSLIAQIDDRHDR